MGDFSFWCLPGTTYALGTGRYTYGIENSKCSGQLLNGVSAATATAVAAAVIEFLRPPKKSIPDRRLIDDEEEGDGKLCMVKTDLPAYHVMLYNESYIYVHTTVLLDRFQ